MARDMTPRQVAEAYLAAWNAHDADAAAAFMADDVTYLDVIVGEPQKGRDAARDKVIKLFVTAVPSHLEDDGRADRKREWRRV